MKKKIRKILVDNREYFWIVSPIDQNYIYLKVWFSGRKTIPWIKVKYRFDDPWLNYGLLITCNSEQIAQNFQLNPVQPKLVARIIREIYELYSTQSDRFRKTLNYEYSNNELLEAAQNVNIRD
ncbi:MAG: hypothetical protein AAF378_06350 [Cyanobacteria bacterium P01_A01_bin.84]